MLTFANKSFFNSQKTMPTVVKPRLRYFDMLKGVAIFLVVMGHVITMCVREVDRTALFKFLEQIHMPLFFFISGWFTFKQADAGVVRPALGQRALRLLLPMVVVSSLWVLYFPHSGLESPIQSTFGALWADTWKNGYWFTLVLFEIILIYVSLTPLLSRCRGALASCGVAFVAWAVLVALYLFVLPVRVSGYLSLELAATFFPIFMFGVLARRYREGFMAAVHNSWWQTAAMAAFGVSLYVCCWPWEFGLEGLSLMALKAVLHVSLAIIALAVFEAWANHAFAADATSVERSVASVWEYLGKQSLGIYLLHYFFLFPMGSVFRPTLVGLNLSFVPMAAFAAFWAVCIIACVLGVIKILQPSRTLSLLLTGSK